MFTRRRFVALGIAAGAGTFVGCSGVSSSSSDPPGGSGQNPIVTENARAGDTSWPLTQPALNTEIEGYASAVSVNRGEQISFFVNTTDPTYTIQFFRMGWYAGAGARSMGPPTTLTGTVQPGPIVDPSLLLIDAGNWSSSYTLSVPGDPSDPTNWCSGIYLAKLVGSSGAQAYMIFVVRDDVRQSDLLFQSSVNTYCAYNFWGGSGLYSLPRAYKVSFNRPYQVQYQTDLSVGGGHFLFWEYNMVRFLEREGYDVTYSTDVDTHLNGSALMAHKGFLSVGHDEYWSWQMRQNVTAARDGGVNLGFFGANCCFWQIRYEPSPVTGVANRTITCYKYDAITLDPYHNGPQAYLTTTEWRGAPVSQPEAELIGVMYGINYDGIGDAFAADIVVTDTSNFIFQNTGLQNGQHLPGLLGYEADAFFPNSSPPGTMVVAQSPFVTPAGLQGVANMTSYQANSGATVVGVGSIEWSWGLDDYYAAAWPKHGVLTNPAAQQATRNILAQFGASGSS